MMTYTGVCTRVVDGDTIKVDIPLKPFSLTQGAGVRLDGLDTPESHTSDYTQRTAGKLVSTYLKELIEGKVVQLECEEELDKYGRVVARVLLEGQDINALLLSKHYARPYDGGHKNPWDVDLLKAIITDLQK